jgi:hypothetical protein
MNGFVEIIRFREERNIYVPDFSPATPGLDCHQGFPIFSKNESCAVGFDFRSCPIFHQNAHERRPP